MAQVLCHLPASQDPRYLNRGEPNSDCGIYQMNEDMALVQSVDFFTPVVDDPYIFGEIAAANALSDVYAVGGTPLTVLNLVCFPCGTLGNDVLQNILAGGHAKVAEAGASVLGGHSIEDEEPKYGLAVTGSVHPQKIISSSGARPGDLLVLTKPIGTGIITTALKGGALSIEEAKDAVQGMTTLNADASLAMQEVGVEACTDITGFGLLGHAVEMAEASNVCLELSLHKLPFYPRAWEIADEGIVPGGTYRNREYYRGVVALEVDEDTKETEINLIADAQTSGGLLMSIKPEQLEPLWEAFSKRGVYGKVIGKITEPGYYRGGAKVIVKE